ncbi:MAG TPA: CPBP family intramembrane glutamic endopeptidase [Verrucomicrobiae bacterium]|nr:CPBP family intramembrane glutamic endopeptidase [Verrucomicrobiae bacterium]
MLSWKPWSFDGLVRLFVSVLICSVFIGGVGVGVVSFFYAPHHESSWKFLAASIGAIVCFLGGIVVLGRPRKSEKFVKHFIALLVFVYVGFFLMWLAARLHGGPENREIGNTWKAVVVIFCFQGAALILVSRFLREQRMTWNEAFGLKNDTARALLFGAVLGIGLFSIGGGLQVLSGWALEHLHHPAQEQTAVQVIRAAQSWPNRLVLGIAAVLIAPAAEEILFRGLLYPTIKQAGYPRLAIWITALLFGAIHMNLATFIPLTVLALLLIWIYEKTGNLLASITAHAVFNLINFLMLFVAETFNRLPHP